MKNKVYEKLGEDGQSKKDTIETQEAVDANQLKDVLDDGADKIENTLKSLEVKIDSLAQENPEKADKLRKALKKLWARFLIGFEITGFIFIAGTANYERTRYGVKDNLNPDKSVHYIHEDKETTRILEFLSGRKELDRKTRFEIARTKILQSFDDKQIKYSEELKTATEEEFIKIISDMAKKAKIGDFEDYLNYHISTKKDWLDVFVPDKLDRADDVYTALWKVEKLSGNPRVRWLDTDSSVVKSIALKIGDYAYYNPATNTVFLHSPDYWATYVSKSSKLPEGIQSYQSVDDFIAENSHAKQFNEKPISSFITGFRDVITALVNTIKTRNLDKAFGLNYKRPGALEYEAHSVIEPELRKKFNEELKPEFPRIPAHPKPPSKRPYN